MSEKQSSWDVRETQPAHSSPKSKAAGLFHVKSKVLIVFGIWCRSSIPLRSLQVKMAPKAVSQREESELQAMLERLALENEEIDGDAPEDA